MNDKKWITLGLRKSIKHKDKLFRRKLKEPSTENIIKYKKYKNLLTTCLRQSEKMYYQKLFSDTRNGINNFWKAFGSTLNSSKRKSKSYLSKIEIDGKSLTNDCDIADAMNSYFSNVGNIISKKLGKAQGHFKDYLKNKLSNSFVLSPVTEHDILKELSKIKPNKAAGPDDLKPKLIKICKMELIQPLTLLYNKSIADAKFPSELKLAKVIALHKKSSVFLPQNYRPISLLNCFSKIFESLVYRQMIKFIEKHKIIYINQYGFRILHSSTLALIDIVDKIKNALDKNEYGLGIYLDAEKAFDLINHDILLSKLEHYGFRGHIQNFFRSYLNNRQQYTYINGHTSNTANISCGVPQGSILGPLLFILYVNDINNAIDGHETEIILFADDTSLFLHHKDPHVLIQHAEDELSNIYKWFTCNRLSLSLGKSNFILFHGKNKNSMPNLTRINIHNATIPRVTHTKYIGLILDEHLTWDNHINTLCKVLTSYFTIFYNIREFVDLKLARMIYYACIYSRINYAIEIYGSAAKTKIDKLQTLQNKLMKTLLNKPYIYSTQQLHSELKILTIKDIYYTHTLEFVYKCLNCDQIKQFKDYYKTCEHNHNYSTRQNNLLHVARTSTELGKTTTQIKGSVLWNNLELKFKKASSLTVFKSRLKENILNQYES
jgi:hypothetical protein